MAPQPSNPDKKIGRSRKRRNFAVVQTLNSKLHMLKKAK